MLLPAIQHASVSPKLTREEELALVTAWKETGDRRAVDRLIRSQLRYVVGLARKYRRYGIPQEELIAEGNAGLVHALKKFEPERGHRFVTYSAYWIRAYILGYVTRSWSVVETGSGALRSKTFFRLRREKNRLMNLHNDIDIVEKELAVELGTSVERIRNMLQRLEARDLSTDASYGSETDRAPLIERLESDVINPEEDVSEKEMKKIRNASVSQALTLLDRRERLIAEKRLMADHEDASSLAELGKELGVSRERARQLEERAKKKLRLALDSFAPETALAS